MNLVIYIGYSDILDIVIIWPKIPCPHHYHCIHYVLYWCAYSRIEGSWNIVKKRMRKGSTTNPNDLLETHLVEGCWRRR